MIREFIFTAAVLASASAAVAQTAAPADHGAHHPQAVAQSGAVASTSDFAEGEVRKVDKAAGKVTLRHGEIKSLDMPPMTMVFAVARSGMLDQVKAGDKVRFRATNDGGTFTVTDLEVVK